MRKAWIVGALGALVGCGEKMVPEDYVDAYLEQYCAYWLECSDPAQLTFEGTNSEEACLAIHGDRIASQWQGCKLVDKLATQCLDQMAALTCPADGAALDDQLPPVCATVWEKCVAQPVGSTPTVENPDEGT